MTRGADWRKSASAPAAARKLGVLRRFESPTPLPAAVAYRKAAAPVGAFCRNGLATSLTLRVTVRGKREQGRTSELLPSPAAQLPRRQKGRDFPDVDCQLGPEAGGQGLPHPTGCGQAWPKLAKTGQTWTQVAKYGQGWPNLDNRWTAFPALLRRCEHPAECKVKTLALFLPCFCAVQQALARPLAGTKRGKMASENSSCPQIGPINARFHHKGWT